MEKVFKTKTGFCHVTEDQIILTRDGIVGSVAKVTVGNSISRILIIYGLISLGLFYFAYDSYLKEGTFTTILFGLLGPYLINGIFKSLNNSATPIIDRKDIKTTKFIKGTSGLTRSWFLYQEKIKMIINHNATTQDKGIKRWSERLNELMEQINIYQSSNNV